MNDLRQYFEPQIPENHNPLDKFWNPEWSPAIREKIAIALLEAYKNGWSDGYDEGYFFSEKKNKNGNVW